MGIAQRKFHPALWIPIKIAITVAGFSLLRRSGALSSESFLKTVADSSAVAAMIGVALAYDFLRGVSLYWILHQTDRPTSLWLCVKAQLIGHFFNFLVPGQAGGFGAKSVYLTRLLNIPWKSAINVLAVEMLMGFLALTTFTAVNVSWLALRTEDPELAARSWIYAAISVIITVGIPILLRLTRKRGWIGDPSAAGNGWKDEVRRAAVWLDQRTLCLEVGALALITFFMKCIVLWIAARQLGAPAQVDYPAICSSFSLGVIVSLVPVAPGGLITGNLGFGSALALLTGVSFTMGADIYTALWAVHAALGVLGGFIFLGARHTSTKIARTP